MAHKNCPKCSAVFDSRPGDAGEAICPRCLVGFAFASGADAATTVRDDARLGTVFRGMKIEGVLGRGGMGVVYRATQTELGREVALKLVSDELARDAEFVERFRREAQVLSSFTHPNLVAVHEFGFENGVPFLVMEKVEGDSLRQLLRRRKLDPEAVLRIVPQICDALEVAHARGVIHRDIKPENVLVTPDGRVKIADFGLARAPGEGMSLTRTGAAMGTPHYMAPEQIENPKSVDCRADLYALGVVFYEMLTGELPIGAFQPPSRRSGAVASLDGVVLKALAREPAARYSSAAELRADLFRALLEGTPRALSDRECTTRWILWAAGLLLGGLTVAHATTMVSGWRIPVAGAGGLAMLGTLACLAPLSRRSRTAGLAMLASLVALVPAGLGSGLAIMDVLRWETQDDWNLVESGTDRGSVLAAVGAPHVVLSASRIPPEIEDASEVWVYGPTRQFRWTGRWPFLGPTADLLNAPRPWHVLVAFDTNGRVVAVRR